MFCAQSTTRPQQKFHTFKIYYYSKFCNTEVAVDISGSDTDINITDINMADFGEIWSEQFAKITKSWCFTSPCRYQYYRGADKSLARPGRKQANVSVRMAWIYFGALPCRGKKKFDDSSRLDVVEIARVPDMLPSLFPSFSTPVKARLQIVFT